MNVQKRSPVHVRIRNFQSIEDLSFTIDGFTCITGKTNIGKSAIIRSIVGALTNSPVSGLVRKGSKFCAVDIFSEKWGLRWEKGVGVSRYTLLDPDGNPLQSSDGKDRILDKVGQGQVAEIANMGFGSVEIGRESLQPWYAPQFSPVFLLNKTGPAVTDFFSEVAHLKVLQNGIILSVRKRKRALESAKEEAEKIRELNEKEARFVGIDKIANLTQEIEQQSESVKFYENKVKIGLVFLSEIQFLRDVVSLLETKVRVPTDYVAGPLEKARLMSTHWSGLEESALQVREIRDVVKVQIPSLPESEWKHASQIQKYNDVGKLRSSIQEIEKVESVKVPSVDGIGDSIEHFGKAVRFHEDVQKLRRSVDLLNSTVSVPIIDFSTDKLALAEQYSESITKVKYEISELGIRSDALMQETAKIRAEIQSIPSCELCGRPTVTSHEHDGQTLD